MLTAKDLMIGDYVIRKNVPKEILIVDAIDSIRDIVYLDLDGLGITEKIENIEPISLTPEILEKIGFWCEHDVGYVTEEYEYEIIYSTWNHELRILKNREQILKLKYFDEMCVHELQHALRFCRIDKEIKL